MTIFNYNRIRKLLNLEFNIFRELEPRKEGLTHSEIQKMYFDEGIRWVKENPNKAITLAIFDLYYFLMPGLNPNWYSRGQVLFSLFVSLPIYVFAYLGIFLALKQDFRKHFWILGLFISMIISQSDSTFKIDLGQ